MKCPTCSAKLLLVQDEWFCLQCGKSISAKGHVATPADALILEETTDPILQNAITDISHRPIKFRGATIDPPASPLVAQVKASVQIAVDNVTGPSGALAVLSKPSVIPPGAPVAVSKAQVAPAPRVPPVVVLVPQKTLIPKLSPAAPAHLPRLSNLLHLYGSHPVVSSADTAKPILGNPVDVKVNDLAEQELSDEKLWRTGPKRRISTGWHRPEVHRALVAAVAAVAIFVSANVATAWYYTDRVYPGIRVAGADLGGEPLGELDSAVAVAVPQTPAHLVIGSSKYQLALADVGAKSVQSNLAERVRGMGRGSFLPLFGAIGTLYSSPLTVDFTFDDVKLSQLAAKLANESAHPASDAMPLIVAGNVVLVTDKTGEQVAIDSLKDGLKSAVTLGQTVVINTTKNAPNITAASYNHDIDDAQAKLSLKMTLKIKLTSVSPTAAEVGDWLVFGAPGSGVTVNPARVQAYVASLPGSFNRPAAVAALISALQAKQPLEYTTVSVKKGIVPTKLLPNAVAPLTFAYCMGTKGTPQLVLSEAATTANNAYAEPDGWSLGGRLRFGPAATACNFTLWIVSADQMPSFSPACATSEATCRVGNDLIINLAHWKTAPTDWKLGLEAYRIELINHETGHWLGFNHAGCGIKATPEPILTQPTLTLGGCSPRWYTIPAELQPLKVLPGF